MKTAAPLLWRLVLVSLLALTSQSYAEDVALHSLVDQRVAAGSVVPIQLCSDAEFLRRVSLDLIGMPPTADEARAFLADNTADKRQALVDRLLTSPNYVRHQASMLDLMLMERRANTHVTADEWQVWLMTAVRENKPWNLLAREILSADGTDPATRPASRFVLDRLAEPNLLTRDVGRIFFGKDLQCAQCHDHAIVRDYLQADYHGLLAFFSGCYLQVLKDAEQEKTVLAEKAGSELAFESVFVGVPHRTGARLPAGVTLQEPFLLPGEEYAVAPAENVKAVPLHSRRAKLAELSTNGSNPAFNENIVNRLWAQMFGRGLVHPLDLHHADNPASDPELLQILSTQFTLMNYDMRAFLRELALTRVYQRQFDVPHSIESWLGPAAQALATVEDHAAQLALLEDQARTAGDEYSSATDAWYAAEAIALPVTGEVEAARKTYADAKTKFDEAAQLEAAALANHRAHEQSAAALLQALAAVQQAAQALTSDAEIPIIAQKLVEKSEQVASQVTALNTTVQELATAKAAAAEVLRTALTTLEAGRAKLTPLVASEVEAEQLMLVARNKSAASTGALLALQQRVETIKLLASVIDLEQQSKTTDELLAQREAELNAAEAALAASSLLLDTAQAETEKVAADAKQFQEALAVAQAHHREQLQTAEAIAAAAAATDVALRAAADDPVLAEVAAKLQERVTFAETQVAETQRGIDAAADSLQQATTPVTVAQQAVELRRAEREDRQRAVTAAAAARDLAKGEVQQRAAERARKLDALTERWTNDFTFAALKPLTPEQLCWSVFRVTGVYDRFWDVEVAELEKSNPLTAEQRQDAQVLAARQFEIEQRVYDKLKGNIGTFVAFYGAAAGQPQSDFFSTADQALFASNGASINGWVAPAGDNVTERVILQSDPGLAAEELYLAALSRLPTPEESGETAEYLKARETDRGVAAQELVWALLNSAEFRFNY